MRDSQEKVVQALQHYTNGQYPDMPSKFAELLLRMPELHRVCQVNHTPSPNLRTKMKKKILGNVFACYVQKPLKLLKTVKFLKFFEKLSQQREIKNFLPAECRL